MSDLINVMDYDRIADIFGFDDPENPLFRPQPAKESDEDDSER